MRYWDRRRIDFALIRRLRRRRSADLICDAASGGLPSRLCRLPFPFLDRTAFCVSRSFCKRAIIRFPAVQVALENLVHHLDHVLETAPAGTGHHHPTEHHRLAEMTVGRIRRQVIEERRGRGLLDRRPDLPVASESLL